MVPSGSLKSRRPHKQRFRKTRVLFVCIGNSCRSQMAEAFARTYGPDVLIAASAGLRPAMVVSPLTFQVLAEKNIRADGQFPKSLDMVLGAPFDVVVNISGFRIPASAPRVIEWSVQDPIGLQEEVFRDVANQLESLVMGLILQLRSEQPAA